MKKSSLRNIKELFSNSFFLFVFFNIVFLIINYIFTKNLLPTAETKDFWFYSGLFMVLFSIIFIEPYFSSPKNVLTNVIPLLLVFLSIKSDFTNDLFWWAFFSILLILLFCSIIAMSLEDKNKSEDYWKNKTSNFLKKRVVLLGQGRVLYSSIFIYFLLTYYSIQNIYTLILFIFWFFVISINPKNFKSSLSFARKERDCNAIGEIFCVQSKKIFLVKLFDDKNNVRNFDIVKFRYVMQDSCNIEIVGIVFDTYLLNQEKWAKILQLNIFDCLSKSLLERNVVYKIPEDKEKVNLNRDLKVDLFIGVVSEGSEVGRLKFEYSKKDNNLQEGDLIELEVENKRIFYQVVGGLTRKEFLEAKNESSYIEGEAIQLGQWIDENLSFQKFGWVPPINTPIFKADTSNITIRSFEYPEYKLGRIPDTTLPSVINLHEAVSHHMALLGITGSGKSFLARQIIKQLEQDTKVICVDFTGEWKKYLDDVKELNKDNIGAFLSEENQKRGIVELPSMSNTTEIIASTEKLLSTIFDFAKSSYDKGSPVKICLILEEAHTIVPEASFLGVNNWDSKAIVNKMGQIALQGRKYGVGLFVIAQRTANVSKTILTQCNTVICFQAFDETSFNFLGNYIGKDLVQTLPNLKQYHAIVAGKAIKSNLPMIVDLTKDDQQND